MNIIAHEQRHAAILRKYAPECTVLLKKDGKFPLSAPCKLALYGNGARNTVKGGTGSGNVYVRENISAEDALKSAGFTITTTTWMDAYDADRAKHHGEFIESIKREAKERGVSTFVMGFGKIEPEYDYNIPLEGDGDACVYVLSRISGEGNDRCGLPGDVLLTETEIRDILALNEKYDRFILVLNVGGVVDLTPVLAAKNILYLSQLGSVTGTVLADLLLGRAYPSGKLTTSWAALDKYSRIGEFRDKDDTRYKEGLYVGYRYFDTAGVDPLFPFGFGLSYTDFSLADGIVSTNGTSIQTTATVRNTGSLPGKEVLQIYISSPASRLMKPYQSLAAFAKTRELGAGECEKVTLSFDLCDLASYDENSAAYLLEKGDYILRLGISSRNTSPVAVLRLKEDLITKQVKNLLGKTDFTDALIPCAEEKVTAPVIEIDAGGKLPDVCNYSCDHTVSAFAQSLTNEELASLCIGAFEEGTSGAAIGSSSFHVAGAAGETTNRLEKKLYGKRLVLADGPAGLRLSPKWMRNEDGTALSAMEKLPDGLDEIVPDAYNAHIAEQYRSIPKEKIEEHITTAIPIGTAIAQSWNEDLCTACGDIVGSEMELYGVDLWLAPALNIHRNILCGRNFEYYSEDPLISGKMTAAITRGVQAHPGCGVTIKHFAANNQETNRYNSNSIVSERAMREIYLKGFEIAVREGHPKAIMTSYNLLNGEHTSQRRDLIEGILRGEWGFSGIVMTDWITTGKMFDHSSKHPPIYANKVISAGNNLIMPGGQPDYDDLLESLENKQITRDTLLISATKILQMIEELTGVLQ